MNLPDNSNTPKPQFVREREAWLKAGAHLALLYLFVAILPLGVIVGLTSMLFRLDPYTAVATMLVGTWVVGAGIGFYIDVKAGQIAARGGVQVDRF